jgi:hypothetical protein
MPGGVKNLRRNKKLLCPVPKKAWGQPMAKLAIFWAGTTPAPSFSLFWNTVCQIQIILQLLKKFVLIWNTLKLLL